jgi:hypothetical protein
VDFSYFPGGPGKEQNPFGDGGFSGVDVRGNPDVAGLADGHGVASPSGHAIKKAVRARGRGLASTVIEIRGVMSSEKRGKSG